MYCNRYIQAIKNHNRLTFILLLNKLLLEYQLIDSLILSPGFTRSTLLRFEFIELPVGFIHPLETLFIPPLLLYSTSYLFAH